MARNSLPTMSNGRGTLSKLVVALFGLAVLMLVVRYPNDAAHFVTEIFHLIGNVVGGLVVFLRQVTG